MAPVANERHQGQDGWMLGTLFNSAPLKRIVNRVKGGRISLVEIRGG